MHHPPPVMAADAWLLSVLDDLYAALRRDDLEKGRSGRDSSVFEFYDCGLAAICAALKWRVPDPFATCGKP